MKTELEKMNEYTSKISLTPGERIDMFQNIRTYADTYPVQPRYSSFIKYSFAYASMLAVIVGTTATSIAAEDSLPGDTLYSFKTNINEEVVKAFSFSNIQKAKANVALVDKRMGELEKMIVTQKDTPEKIEVIAIKLEEHKKDIQEFTGQKDYSTQDKNINEETTAIYATLESVIDSHLDILEGIAQKEEAAEIATTSNPPNTLITNTAPTSPKKDIEDTTVVLTMKANPEREEDNENNSQKQASSTPQTDKDVTGEKHAVTEIANFEADFEPLLKSIKERSDQQDRENSAEIRKNTRKKILETAEEELQIDIEEKTTINIKTNII
jgi:hypothetical protein